MVATFGDLMRVPGSDSSMDWSWLGNIGIGP